MDKSLPGTLDRQEHVALSGRRWEPWLRRAGLIVFAAFVAVGLANVFGQRSSDTTVTTSDVTMVLHAPGAVRSGLIYEARLRIEARTAISKPGLFLTSGWFEGMTLNSIQPDASEQTPRDGGIVFVFGGIAAGDSLTVRLQYQVNPTAVGRRVQDVELEDDGEPIARIERSIVVFP